MFADQFVYNKFKHLMTLTTLLLFEVPQVPILPLLYLLSLNTRTTLQFVLPGTCFNAKGFVRCVFCAPPGMVGIEKVEGL